MSLRRPKVSDDCSEERFCCQLNNDQLLFFPTYDDMKSYIKDYHSCCPIYQSSMFVVRFYNIK